MSDLVRRKRHIIELFSEYTIDGKRQERSREEHPYSYSRFCIYKQNGKNGWRPTDHVVWTDRLYMQYGKRHEELFKRHLGTGQYYSTKNPKDIEAFLSELFEEDVVLTGIEEECNVSNGYPYWLLYFRKKKKQ